MSAIARVLQTLPETRFAIYCEGALVANVKLVTGLAEAIEVTREAADDPTVYVPGLHVAGLDTAATIEWFASWRIAGGKRDLLIYDHAREQGSRVTGAFIGAWSDGSWYDLVVDAAVVNERPPG